MKKVKIDKLKLFGVQPETENEIPDQLSDITVSAGNNVQINGNTISATDTTYPNLQPLQYGNNVSLVTDGDKYYWNSKQDALNQTQLDAVNSGITAGKIMQSPYTTSEQNPLVNQEFVNSSIATNTANFIGTFNSVEELLNINVIETNSILSAGSTLKEGSVINGSAIIQDEILSNDLIITQTSFPNGGSILIIGSTIAQGSWINHNQYDTTVITQDNLTIETWTNNDYAFVTNNKDNPYEFNTYADLIAWSNPNMYLITNWDYAWVINTEDSTKLDLYRFDILTHTWELRVSKTDKNAVTLNSAFNRYKYIESTSTWVYEFTLNNSSFTASQWAAINSGITSQLVQKLSDLRPLTRTQVRNTAEDVFYPALPAPTNVQASGTDISFNEVQGAESYVVYANGNEIGEVQA